MIVNACLAACRGACCTRGIKRLQATVSPHTVVLQLSDASIHFQELEHVHVPVQRAAVPLQKAVPLCSRSAAPEACTWTGMERQSSAFYAIPCCSLRSSHMAQPANAAVPCSWRQLCSRPYSYVAMVIPHSSSQGRGFAVWTAGFQDASQASPASWFHRPALSHRSMARCFRAPASCLAA